MRVTLALISDEKIKGHMATLQEILQNPDFAPLHGIGKEVNGMLSKSEGACLT